MVNAVLLQQMLVQQLWWDEPQLKAVLADAEVRAWHARGLYTLPQILRAGWERAGRVLLYRVAVDTEVRVVLVRVAGERAEVIAPVVRRDRQCVYIIVGDPEKGELIAHRRVVLGEERIEVAMKVRRPVAAGWWLYVLSDVYIGIDQMYRIPVAGGADGRAPVGKGDRFSWSAKEEVVERKMGSEAPPEGAAEQTKQKQKQNQNQNQKQGLGLGQAEQRPPKRKGKRKGGREPPPAAPEPALGQNRKEVPPPKSDGNRESEPAVAKEAPPAGTAPEQPPSSAALGKVETPAEARTRKQKPKKRKPDRFTWTADQNDS
jgi:hypothetical protein